VADAPTEVKFETWLSDLSARLMDEAIARPAIPSRTAVEIRDAVARTPRG
jgi:hypothetical protein